MATRSIFFLLMLALAASCSRNGAASAGAGWDDDNNLLHRQAAMKEALRVMSSYNPDTMRAESVQLAMAFVNSELAHLRPIARAISKMPETTADEVRAKEEARAANRERLTRHLASLLPGGSVKIDEDL